MSWHAMCCQCKSKRKFEGASVGDQMAAWYAEGWRMIGHRLHCAHCAKGANKDD